MAKFNFGSNAGKRSKRDPSSDSGNGSEFDSSVAGNSVDPDSAYREASSAAGSDDGSAGSAEPVATPKRRGRPPGSRNKGNGGGSAAKKVSPHVNGIEKTLVSLHLIAATITSVPELALEDAEASAIAEAIANVNEHYSIPGIDEGPASIVMLVGTLLAIYGKRYLILRAKKTPNKKPDSAKSRDDNNVSPFPSSVGSATGSMFGIGAA